jgi:hypothetical protein
MKETPQKNTKPSGQFQYQIEKSMKETPQKHTTLSGQFQYQIEKS